MDIIESFANTWRRAARLQAVKELEKNRARHAHLLTKRAQMDVEGVLEIKQPSPTVPKKAIHGQPRRKMEKPGSAKNGKARHAIGKQRAAGPADAARGKGSKDRQRASKE